MLSTTKTKATRRWLAAVQKAPNRVGLAQIDCNLGAGTRTDGAQYGSATRAQDSRARGDFHQRFEEATADGSTSLGCLDFFHSCLSKIKRTISLV